MRYLADKVSLVSSSDVTGADMQEWLGNWPWLVALDGMDEVVSPKIRELVSDGISDFLIEVAQKKADVLLIITTRPQGYLGEFGSEDYREVRLRDLKASEALSYSHMLTTVRLGEDPETLRQVNKRIAEATNAPETSRLMRTPLQTTIMTLLLERRQRVPSDRYQLFHAYFDTIYAREANKPTELGRFLEDYRSDVEAIHEAVALEVQQQAELIAEHEGILPASDLDRHAFARLKGEGIEEDKARILTEQVVMAATNRLVLLVPRGDSGIGFEVRSLQEYLAARALTRGEGPEVLERLRPLVPSAHWRNTWLFAAGRLFAEREGLRDQVISLIEAFDNDSTLSWLVHAGAQLATDLLADDLAIRSPQYRRLLADRAITLLDGPPDATSNELGTLFVRLAREDKLINQKIDQRIMTMLTADGYSSAHARLICEHSTGQSMLPETSITLSSFKKYKEMSFPEDYGIKTLLHGPQALERENLGVGPKFIVYLNSYLPELAEDDGMIIRRLLDTLSKTSLKTSPRLGGNPPGLLVFKASLVSDYVLLQETFSHPAVADAYAELVNSLPPAHWPVAAYLRDIVRTWFARRVTGQNT
jgi:hypothetical protein